MREDGLLEEVRIPIRFVRLTHPIHDFLPVGAASFPARYGRPPHVWRLARRRSPNHETCTSGQGGVFCEAVARDHRAKHVLMIGARRDRDPFEDMISARCRLDQINDAMNAMASFSVVKAAIEFA